MTRLAQQHTVGEIGRPAVAFPPPDVMRLRHLRRQPTHRTSPITLHQRQPLRPGKQPPLPPPVENLTAAPEHTRDHPTPGRHPPCRPDTDRLIDTIHGRRPHTRLQVVQVHPHDHRRPRHRHPPLTPEHMRTEHRESIRLDHRHRPPIRIRRTRIGRILPRREHRRHEPPDRRHHRSRGLDIEHRVQMHHAITLEHRQRPPATTLLLPRLQPVRIEPRLRTHHELAHIIERQTRRLPHQHPLPLNDTLHPRSDTTTIQQPDDQRRRRSTECARVERFAHQRILRRQTCTEQIAPRRRRLPHLDQTQRLPRRDPRSRRDQRRRRPEPLLLRQTPRPQLRTRLPRDPRRHRGLHRVDPSPQRPQSIIHRDQLLPRQLSGITGIRPRLIQASHRLMQRGQFRHT